MHNAASLDNRQRAGYNSDIENGQEVFPLKKEMIQRITLILVMLAVLAYTVYNYVSGGSDFLYFVVAALILLYPLVTNIWRLISDLKK